MCEWLHRWFWPTDQYSKHSAGCLRRFWPRVTLLDQHGVVFRLQQKCADVDTLILLMLLGRCREILLSMAHIL